MKERKSATMLAAVPDHGTTARNAGDPNKAQGEAECRSVARHAAEPWVTPMGRNGTRRAGDRNIPFPRLVARSSAHSVGLPILPRQPRVALANSARFTLGFIRVARLAGWHSRAPIAASRAWPVRDLEALCCRSGNRFVSEEAFVIRNVNNLG